MDAIERRREFYDEEHWPGPESESETYRMAEAIKALGQALETRIGGPFEKVQWSLAFRAHKTEISNHIHATLVGDLNATQKPPDQPSAPSFLKPTHSMTSDRGFDGRGRKIR